MNRRLPSLTGLQAFEAVARHGSFTRAAEELNVTQTAVSHRIARLEAELGLRLFLRRKGGLVLTEPAEGYLTAVSGAFGALYDSTSRLLRRDEQGVLTVSTLTSFAAKWLVPRLAGFQAAHPDIDVRILTSSANVDFGQEDVDLAIRYGDGRWPGLRADLLLEEALVPVCSPRFLEGRDPLTAPEDLAGRPTVHITSYGDDWARWLAAAGMEGLALGRPLKFDLAFAAIEAVIDGAGVGMGRTSLVAYDLANGRLVAPFDLRLRRRAFYIVVPEQRVEQP